MPFLPWDVVDDGEDDGAGQQVLLDPELRQRPHDGEVPLQGDGHGEVDGAGPCDADHAVHHRDDVHRHFDSVPAKERHKLSNKINLKETNPLVQFVFKRAYPGLFFFVFIFSILRYFFPWDSNR